MHRVRRVFFKPSGISCITILKYTLILSPQFTKKYTEKTKQEQGQRQTTNKQTKRKSQIMVEVNSLDM